MTVKTHNRREVTTFVKATKKLTCKDFNERVEEVVEFIKKNPPSTNKEFEEYTKNFFGVKLSCACSVYPDGCRYKVLGDESKYSCVPLMRMWDKHFAWNGGLRILLDATFGCLFCGGVGISHYGQTKLEDKGRLKKLLFWDETPNYVKLNLEALEQHEQLKEIFGEGFVF